MADYIEKPDADTEEQALNVPITVIKSFYPIKLIRLIYLSILMFTDKRLMNHAASAAFYFLMSVIPLALLAILIFDTYLNGYVNISDDFFALLQRINPKLDKEFFANLGFLSGKGKNTIFGTIGILGLIWSSRSIFVSVKNTFLIIFTNSKQSRFIRDTILSFVFIPVVFALSFGIFILNYAGMKIYHLSREYGITVLSKVEMVDLSSSIINILTIFAIAFFAYKFLPDEKMKTSNVITGSIIFTIAMIILQKLLSSVLTLASYYLVYGVISTVIVTLFAVYIIFILFYISAEVVYVGQYFSQLEFSMYYDSVMTGKALFVEKLIFYAPTSAIIKYHIHYKAGEVIFDQNTVPDSVYILRDGDVDLSTNDQIETVNKDEFFGVRYFLSGSQYLATAIAKTDATVLKIPKKYYDTVIKINPAFNNVFVDQLAKV